MRRLRVTGFVLAGVLACVLCLCAAPALAQQPAAPACTGPGECLCDNSYEDCREALLTLIRNEEAGIDVSYWFMTDSRYVSAIIARWRAGVPVRIIVDTRADASYAGNQNMRNLFVDAGIPVRNIVASGINHWKAMLFAGQRKVQFSAANFSNGSLSPIVPYRQYVDEAIYFTDDSAIVDSFFRKFDDHWTDAVNFANLANIAAPVVRNYPEYPVHPDMNFVPDQHYENRLRAQTAYETRQIDAVMFRIMSDKLPDELIRRHQAGVRVRLITEEQEYRNPERLWHSFNVDRMFLAGIPIKVKDNVTDQDMHQKSIVLHSRELAAAGARGPMVVFGSSNWTSSSANSQREHNYFTTKPWMVDWFVWQFERKWNNLQADATPIGADVFIPFTPLPPDAPLYLSPADDSLGQLTTGVTLRWEGGYWAHKYDVYLDTTPSFSNPVLVDYMPGSATAGMRSTKESYVTPTLLPGVTYYWRVVSKTMANLTRVGPTWRFTTTGGVPPPPEPTGLSGTAVAPTRVDLAWMDVAGEEGYKVERKLANSATWAQIGTAAANATVYQDANSGLTAGVSYDYRIRAYTTGGNSPYSNVVRVTPQPRQLSASDVVLHAFEAPVTAGRWSAVADATAAGGQRMQNPNDGATRINTPLANPAHYFETEFTAEAGRPYRLWMRGRATNNSGYNDSVHLQFSDTVTSQGLPAYRIGTTTGLPVNLEECSGCGLNGWGWQDTADGPGVLGPLLYFETSGAHTIRVQVREDGAAFDQIVLSPGTFLNEAPGASKNDTTILPRQAGTSDPPDPLPSGDIILFAGESQIISGSWAAAADASAAGGAAMLQPDAARPKVSTPSAAPAHYFELTFTAEAGRPYRLWIRGRAERDRYYNDSVWVQFSGSVDAGGAPVYRIGTTSATDVNLEDCDGCGLSGWGWQDNGWGAGVPGPEIHFETSGPQTIRVQTREDGIAIDQIVLSPTTYLTSSPGALRNDTTILRR